MRDEASLRYSELQFSCNDVNTLRFRVLRSDRSKTIGLKKWFVLMCMVLAKLRFSIRFKNSMYAIIQRVFLIVLANIFSSPSVYFSKTS